MEQLKIKGVLRRRKKEVPSVGHSGKIQWPNKQLCGSAKTPTSTEIILPFHFMLSPQFRNTNYLLFIIHGPLTPNLAHG